MVHFLVFNLWMVMTCFIHLQVYAYHSSAPNCFKTLCTTCEAVANTGTISIAPFYPDTFCENPNDGSVWGFGTCILYAYDCASAYTSHATITWAEASDYDDTGAIEIDTDAEASGMTSPTPL